MFKKYKYDIAISFAEEDLGVAEQIAKALKNKYITYYLYTEHKASNWGQHILKISLGVYGAEARYVLMLTSKIFAEKYWAGIENQISQIFGTGKSIYILQLRLDDTVIDGLSKYKVFVQWKDNPEEIAGLLKEKIKKHKRLIYKQRLLIIVPVLVALMAIVLFILVKNGKPVSYEISLQKITKDLDDSLRHFADLKDSGVEKKQDSKKPDYNLEQPARDFHKEKDRNKKKFDEDSLRSTNTEKQYIIIQGTIEDAETGNLIDGAQVNINSVISTSQRGKFEISIPVALNQQNAIKIIIRKEGYEPYTDITTPFIRELTPKIETFPLKKIKQ